MITKFSYAVFNNFKMLSSLKKEYRIYHLKIRLVLKKKKTVTMITAADAPEERLIFSIF